MKALTLKQPWASLIAEGQKRFETRSWATKYRGPIAIHASKRLDPNDAALLQMEPFKSALTRDPAALPTGAIIATGYLSDCFHSAEIGEQLIFSAYEAGDGIRKEAALELAFGNFSPGRYAWLIEHVALLPEPVHCNGRLYLWDTEPHALVDIAEMQIMSVVEAGGARCVLCGCTAHLACGDGCGWAKHDPPTCTSCVDALPLAVSA